MQRDLLEIKLRDNLVRQRVDIISSLRFTLKSLGIALPSPKSASFARHARELPGAEHAGILALIEPSLRVPDAMTEQIRRLEEAIETMAAEKYPEVELLTQVAGVGPPTSLTFIPTIGDPTRFGRKLQGYWNYYGVIGNSKRLWNFAWHAKRLVYKWLNRRSQRRSFTWARFAEAWERWGIPSPRVVEKPWTHARQSQPHTV